MNENETQFTPKSFDPSSFQAKDFDDFGEEKVNEVERRLHEMRDYGDTQAPPGAHFPRPKKMGIIILLIIAVLALMTALGVFRGNSDKIKITKHVVQINTKAPLFVNTSNSLGLNIDRYTGFFNTATDGSKLVFSALSNNNPQPQTYIANLESGAIQPVSGNIMSDWINNEILTLAVGDNAVVHDFANNREFNMSLGGMIRGSISPDGKLYIMHTLAGLQTIDITNGLVKKISSSVYDGAFAWYSDNTHVLGYRDTGVKLANGENARILTVWNITDNTFADLPIQVPVQELKYVQWVVPYKVARVNGGYDDNSHDYMVDLNTNKIIDIGETSGMLYGGIKTDINKGLLATVGSIYNNNTSVDLARIYDSTGNIIHEVRFQAPAKDYAVQRESVQIVDMDNLLYVRKYFNTKKPMESKNELVLLDMKTGVENVYAGVGTRINKVELIEDKDTWIALDPNQFYIGSVKTGVISPSIVEASKQVTEEPKKDMAKPLIDTNINTVPTKSPNNELLRQYLNGHLNELSSVKPVLGGKFYVTDLQVTNSKSGIVWYEDGHIAGRGYFNYAITDGSVYVSNFQAEKLLVTGR